MNSDPARIPTEFLLKQIDNEIAAAFTFVEAARKAFRHQQPTEGVGALDKALKTHQEILTHVAASPVSQIRAVAHQLAELREAIDWLRESIPAREK